MSWLQDHPLALDVAYGWTRRSLRAVQRWLHPGGVVERVFIFGEEITKGPIFDCRMCGQCVLHQTGMTCPMTCPKELRNGPCGGVRLDGRCEIRPDMACPWVLAWKRADRMGQAGLEIERILPPLDRRRVGRSAWILDLNTPGAFFADDREVR
jgi:hypothetical protein